MYRVKVRINFVDGDYSVEEYSGVYHDNKDDAEKELYEAKLRTVDDETVDYLYIEEV